MEAHITSPPGSIHTNLAHREAMAPVETNTTHTSLPQPELTPCNNCMREPVPQCGTSAFEAMEHCWGINGNIYARVINTALYGTQPAEIIKGIFSRTFHIYLQKHNYNPIWLTISVKTH